MRYKDNQNAKKLSVPKYISKYIFQLEIDMLSVYCSTVTFNNFADYVSQ